MQQTRAITRVEAYVECSVRRSTANFRPDSSPYRWVNILSFEDRTKNSGAALSQFRRVPLLLAGFDANWPFCSPYSVRLDVLYGVFFKSNVTQTTVPTVRHWTSLQGVRCQNAIL